MLIPGLVREVPATLAAPSESAGYVYERGCSDCYTLPMPFADAAYVWAEGASIACPYMPPEFAYLARLMGSRIDWQCTEVSESLVASVGSALKAALKLTNALRDLVQEAERRANWRAAYEQGNDRYIQPRSAVFERMGLVWRTSVTLVLAPAAADEGWVVFLLGHHIERRAAMSEALHRLHYPDLIVRPVPDTYVRELQLTSGSI
jgi:hypothetical protein